jgi:ubiquinone/menaquinone biosynthesis C-methylase UbiE
MAYEIRVKRSDFASYREWLSEQEYRLLKKVILGMLRPYARPDARLLDMACWDGEATAFYGKHLGIADLHGLDFFDEQIAKASANGVKVRKCDLEMEAFPYADASFDIVVANQIFEHLKQIYNPLSEIHRVLKPGGILLFSVPNLASFHSRIQLLLGVQPSTIKLFEAHVRAFTPRALRPFLTFNGLFSIRAFTGSGWYPFPPAVSEPLSKLLPGTSVFQLYALRKEKSGPADWKDEIKRRGVQSNF